MQFKRTQGSLTSSCLFLSYADIPNDLTTPCFFQILLVFPHNDVQLKGFQNAAKKMYSGEAVVDVAKTSDEAMSLFLSKNHDLIIIDHRPHNVFVPASLCKTIRGTRAAGQTVIVALLKSL